MKKSNLMIYSSALLIILLVISLQFNKINYVKDSDYLYENAIAFLKENNNDVDKNKENYNIFFQYKKFGITKDKNYKYVYMWILNESFYLENNELKSGSGSSMPYKFTFKDDKVVKYEIPKDGNEYVSSIKKMFPKEVSKKILKYDYSKLNKLNEIEIDKYYNNDINIITEEINNCDGKEKLYYSVKDKDGKDKKIYLYCLESVKIKYNNNILDFKDYIEKYSIDDIINKLVNTESLWDGGTKIYKDGGTTEYTNNGLTLIKCNTIDGNKDIYIGTKDMKYLNDYCKN